MKENRVFWGLYVCCCDSSVVKISGGEGLLYLHRPHDSGPIQWVRVDVGLKHSAAARPGASLIFNHRVNGHLWVSARQLRAKEISRRVHL